MKKTKARTGMVSSSILQSSPKPILINSHLSASSSSPILLFSSPPGIRYVFLIDKWELIFIFLCSMKLTLSAHVFLLSTGLISLVFRDKCELSFVLFFEVLFSLISCLRRFHQPFLSIIIEDGRYLVYWKCPCPCTWTEGLGKKFCKVIE